MTTPERPPFRLADEEVTDLMDLADRFRHYQAGYADVLAHVTDLCRAYHGEGLVMGDLQHDGTVEWEAATDV